LEEQKEVLEVDLEQKIREVTAANAFIQSRKGRLTKLKSQFLSVSNQIEPKARRELLQLIQEVDQELKDEKGMQEFIENIDTLQDGFISRLAHAFPNLTQKDLIICAYIRMGMSNKEMACQLGISSQSIEMSRYRIRKKMVLTRAYTLNDFLIRF